MRITSFRERRRIERLPRHELQALQLQRLNELLRRIVPTNRFYAEKLASFPLQFHCLDDLRRLTLTTKSELQSPNAEPYAGQSAGDPMARNRTFPLDQYVRCHRTSGSKGQPLVVVDTAEDWRNWIDQWQYVLDVADVRRGDRVACLFSFGPFVGFWSAFEAVVARGAMAIPTGGLTSRARLQLIRDLRATVVLCTPSYGMHLSELAGLGDGGREEGPGAGTVRVLIVAGEPGGSVPEIRSRLETGWKARVIDHAGATEVGPWGFPDRTGNGLYVNESHYICEVLDPSTEQPTQDGHRGELVLTTLTRAGSPLLRYRTGDLVIPERDHDHPVRFTFLRGGVLGRNDDMLIVRGVNLFPLAAERVVRQFPEVGEFRMVVSKNGMLDRLTLELEGTDCRLAEIQSRLHDVLGLQVEVKHVAHGTLPRFEGKAKRLIDLRADSPCDG
ncbi:MAG: phenylacetate--CoA ligase [Planctomycetes bacterium]|nr:phenylacetate--CoA ligase [Planctomycetota bacterium]